MKRLNTIILLLCLCLPMVAQQLETDSLKRAKEREIKTSNLYLYGEAVHEKKKEAIKIAKSNLTSEINKEIAKQPDWQFAKTIEAKDVEYSTDHFDLKRGSKIRAIAYIRKDGITAIFDQKSPDIKLTDKAEEKETSKKKKQETAPPMVDEIYDTKKETTLPELPPAEEPEVKPEEPIVPSDIPEQPAAEEELSAENIRFVETDSAVLNDLLTARNITDAATLLTKYKKSGKLVYGKPGASLAMGKSFLMLYNSKGEITAVLDKEHEDGRMNLFTGEIVNARLSSKTPYIWFQLFD